VAVSIDGYIAGPDEQVDHFPGNLDTFADIFAEYPETCPAHAREALASPQQPGTSTPS